MSTVRRIIGGTIGAGVVSAGLWRWLHQRQPGPEQPGRPLAHPPTEQPAATPPSEQPPMQPPTGQPAIEQPPIQPPTEQAAHPSAQNSARKQAGIASAVVVLVGLLAWFLTTVNVHSPGDCRDEADQAGEAEPEAPADPRDDSVLPMPLELAPNSDTEVDFGRRRSPRTTSVYLQPPEADESQESSQAGDGADADRSAVARAALPDPGTMLVVRAVDFERLSGDVELSSGVNVVAIARVRGNGQGVQLDVCVDPDGIPAGEYQGSIIFDDPRVSAGAVPWTVRLQYEKWWVVAMAALAVSAAAFGYLYSSVRPEGFRPGPRAYFVDHWIGTAAGLVAAGAAYFSAYWASTSWGGEADDWLKGAAVVFTAFTTGFLARFAGQSVSHKREDSASANHAEGAVAKDHDLRPTAK